GGGRWTLVNTSLPGSYLSTQNLVIDPQTPTTLYAGTFGEGVFKSTDGGGSWNAVNTGLPTYPAGDHYPHTNVEALAIDPQTPTTLYAGTYGGIFKSVNGGGDWSAVNSPAVVLLVIDPQTPTTLYGGAEFRGIFKSTDGGAGWRAVNTGLTNSFVVGLAIDPRTPTTLYASAYGQGRSEEP